MTKNITINFTIPINEQVEARDYLLFYRWIPEKDTDVICATFDDKEVRIYLDKSCVLDFSVVTDELINSLTNIAVSKLMIDVVVKGVESDLTNFIYDEIV